MYNQISYFSDTNSSDSVNDIQDNWYEINCIVKKREGLHARPSMRVVDVATTYEKGVRILKPSENKNADAKNIMHLMMLAAEKDSLLTVRIERDNGREVGLGQKIRGIIESEDN